MKRSIVNAVIERAKEVIAQIGFKLPPFAFWTVDDWREKGAECDEIRKCMLGWDVTDFGHGQFDKLGRTLFTLRNGSSQYSSQKDYAEKVILDPEDQKPPLHFHRRKLEDIVNRGGGNILIQLFQSTPDEKPSHDDLNIQIDGVTTRVKAGIPVRLEPGQSICVPPRTFHQFWGERGTGLQIDGKRYTVSGEISRVCDDWNDNFFLEPCQRFAAIDEDEPARHHLVHEYPAAQ